MYIDRSPIPLFLINSFLDNFTVLIMYAVCLKKPTCLTNIVEHQK